MRPNISENNFQRRAGLKALAALPLLAACGRIDRVIHDIERPLTKEELATYNPNLLRLVEDPTNHVWRTELSHSTSVIIRDFKGFKMGRVDESDGMVTRLAPDNSAAVAKGPARTWLYWGDSVRWKTEVFTMQSLGNAQSLLELWLVSPEVVNRQIARTDFPLHVAAFFERFNLKSQQFLDRRDFITSNWQNHPPMNVFRREPNGVFPHA